MPKLQTNGAKQKRTTYMILLLWAAVCFALLVVDWCCWAPNRLDADMASEQLLANLLAQEGGVSARHQRYRNNQRRLVAGMRALGFRPLLDDSLHSPIITAFYSPDAPQYRFHTFYQKLKDQGFVIYPGKVSQSDCFRIGNIGEVYDADITALLAAIDNAMYWKQ